MSVEGEQRSWTREAKQGGIFSKRCLRSAEMQKRLLCVCVFGCASALELSKPAIAEYGKTPFRAPGGRSYQVQPYSRCPVMLGKELNLLTSQHHPHLAFS